FLFVFSTSPSPQSSPLPLHDALPICKDTLSLTSVDQKWREPYDLTAEPYHDHERVLRLEACHPSTQHPFVIVVWLGSQIVGLARSEEHTSELQSRVDLVCRLLLEKKK